jgi:hypothetical protein
MPGGLSATSQSSAAGVHTVASRRPFSRRLPAWLTAAIVAVGLIVLMAPTYTEGGNPFDEGLLMIYPVRVLDGAVPHRDFESNYGPGSFVMLAGVYAVTGASQSAERTVGLVFELAIVLALFSLAASAGQSAALGAAVIGAFLMVALELVALASAGALAFGLIAMALARWGAAGSTPGAADVPAPRARAQFAAGLLVAACALERPDFLPAALLGSLPLLWSTGRGFRRRWALGLALGLSLYVIDAAVVGPAKIERTVSNLIRSEPARRLPLDLLSSDDGHFLLATFVAVAACLATGAWVTRRRPAGAGRVWLGVGLFSLGLLPTAVSRADYVHIVIPALAALPLLPACISAITSTFRPRLAITATLGSAAAVLGVLALTAPTTLREPARLRISRLLGHVHYRLGYPVKVNNRSFLMRDQATATAAQRIVDAAERDRVAGARTLFVGPRDLRRTFENDTYIYYLLDDLRPASYYVELDPLMATGSDLASALRRTDVLILNHAYDLFTEHNAAQRYGSNAPNLVVSRQFCEQLHEGTYELLRRCA